MGCIFYREDIKSYRVQIRRKGYSYISRNFKTRKEALSFEREIERMISNRESALKACENYIKVLKGWEQNTDA